MGGATTICSDKTGTLTQNKMTVVRFYRVGNTQRSNTPNLDDPLKELFLENIAINSGAVVVYKDGNAVYSGSSSECALLQLLSRYNQDYKKIREDHPIVFLHEFNSERKRMSTIVKKNNNYRIYCKGAPDFLLRLSTQYIDLQGNIQPLDDQIRNQIINEIGLFANDSLRTMLFAFQDLGSNLNEAWKDPENCEIDLIVIGFVGIEDPLRPEVTGAIQQCHIAKVVVRMVTGDYINTAKAIARQCGILTENTIAIEGQEFAKKSKIELLNIVPKLRVMARSSPRDKYRLVDLLMEMGEVVAVTGDGSNDSAALKRANVGLSMGQCGTELAKMASDIVIMDDNFNSIVSALKWGRCVYDNVRGFLQFQLTVNFSAMIIAFVGSVYLHESPLRTIQLLWVNLIMDSLGALALATFGPSDALLYRPPYGESDGLLSKVLIRNIVGQTIYQMLALFLILFLSDPLFGIPNDPDNVEQQTHLSSLVFNVFVYMQVFNLLNSRVAGQDMSIIDGLFKNFYFIAIFVIISVLQAIIALFLQSAFDTSDLTSHDWLITFGFGLGSLFIGSILRMIHLKDTTSYKLYMLRDQRKREIHQLYSHMTTEEQWAYNWKKKTDKELIDA